MAKIIKTGEEKTKTCRCGYGLSMGDGRGMGQGEEKLSVRPLNGSFLPQQATQCMDPRHTTWDYSSKNLKSVPTSGYST